MMLTVEGFKKIFDNFEVEGFEINEPSGYPFIEYDDGSKIRRCSIVSMNGIGAKIIYPLFLQRVKQGINRQDELDYHIVQTRHYVEVLDWEYNVTGKYNDNDEGLEQAIKLILDQME